MPRNHAYIARHFWHDGEYANWQASESFPASLLDWLKANYAELIAGTRPDWIKRPEGIVWLYFHDENEIHGRMATRLTACWVDKPVSNIDVVYKELKKMEELIQDDTLSVPVHARVIHQQHFFNRPVVVVGSLALLVIIGYSLSVSKISSRMQYAMQPARSTQASKTPADPVQDKVEFSNKTKKNKSYADISICTKLKKEKRYCFQKYLADKCRQKTYLTYDAWLDELRHRDPTSFNGLNCPSKMKNDQDFKQIKKNISERQRNKLKALMHSGGKKWRKITSRPE